MWHFTSSGHWIYNDYSSQQPCEVGNRLQLLFWHMDRGKEVCNQSCTIELMKFNALKCGQVLGDFTEKEWGRSDTLSVILSWLQCLGSNSAALLIYLLAKKKTHNKPTKKPTPLLSKICMQRFTRSEVCYRNRKKIHSVQPKIWVELREKLASLVKQSSFNFSPFSISDTNKYLLDVRKSRVKFC